MEKEKIWVECMYNTNGASLVLTVGKQYLATIIDEHTYRMENDKGEFDWFSKDRFKIVDKTPILNTIKWNGIDDLRKFIIDENVEVDIQIVNGCIILHLNDFNKKPIWYTHTLRVNKVDCSIKDFIDEMNVICNLYNLKIELDQPKYKINCNKVYTKEEAEKLKENGIDIVEVKECLENQ